MRQILSKRQESFLFKIIINKLKLIILYMNINYYFEAK